MKYQNDDEFDSELKTKFESFKQIKIKRNPDIAAKNRAAYLKQVETLAVSKSSSPRLTLQNRIQTLIGFGKERFAMNPTLISIGIAALLFFGGSSAGVVAAQKSLPNEVLYPVKILTENIQQSLTTQPREKLNLEMNLSQTRLEEINAVLKEGDLPSDPVFIRLQDHLANAFQEAIEASPQNAEELLRLQHRLMEQIGMLEQMPEGQNAEAEAVRLRAREMLETQVQLVDDRLASDSGESNEIEDHSGDQNLNLNINQDQNQNINENLNQEENQNQNTNEDLNQDEDQNQNEIESENENQNTNQNMNLNLNQNQNLNKNDGSPENTENKSGDDNGGSGGNDGGED